MNSNTPIISVIMSVYNEQKYIKEAIESILNQTISNIEIIVIDDCSSDSTVSIIQGIKDKRIRLYQNEENKGLTKNLNYALTLTNGKFIARMDGDDISEVDRFQKQLDFLNKNKDIMLISCQTATFGDQKLINKIDGNPESLRCRMLVRPTLAHPGFMFRAELFHVFGYQYDESFKQGQDYDFAARVSRRFKIGICPYVLLKYRAHTSQVSNKNQSSQFHNADRVRAKLLNELGITFTEKDWNYYHLIVTENKTDSVDDVNYVKDLIYKIIDANLSYKIYDQEILRNTLTDIFCTWIFRIKSIRIFLHITDIIKNDNVLRHMFMIKAKEYTCRLFKMGRD